MWGGDKKKIGGGMFGPIKMFHLSTEFLCCDILMKLMVMITRVDINFRNIKFLWIVFSIKFDFTFIRYKTTLYYIHVGKHKFYFYESILLDLVKFKIYFIIWN